jgi:hypothetical protein
MYYLARAEDGRKVRGHGAGGQGQAMASLWRGPRRRRLPPCPAFALAAAAAAVLLCPDALPCLWAQLLWLPGSSSAGLAAAPGSAAARRSPGLQPEALGGPRPRAAGGAARRQVLLRVRQQVQRQRGAPLRDERQGDGRERRAVAERVRRAGAAAARGRDGAWALGARCRVPGRRAGLARPASPCPACPQGCSLHALPPHCKPAAHLGGSPAARSAAAAHPTRRPRAPSQGKLLLGRPADDVAAMRDSNRGEEYAAALKAATWGTYAFAVRNNPREYNGEVGAGHWAPGTGTSRGGGRASMLHGSAMAAVSWQRQRPGPFAARLQGRCVPWHLLAVCTRPRPRCKGAAGPPPPALLPA